MPEENDSQIIQGGLETEQLLQEALDALPANIAMLDATGAIIAVNASWREFAEEIGFDHADSGVGLQYLAFCNTSGMYRPTHALQVSRGLSEVISGVSATTSKSNTRATSSRISIGTC